jgi:O-antigen ligase
MKTLISPPARADRIRQLCLIAAALLFLGSASVLLLGVGTNLSFWRGLALSSLYLSFCLTQRRLFVPASRQLVRHDRRVRSIE